MFSRRRAASNPASKQPPSASASLAASKAFLRDRDSNPTLSSAAAAAALRTHVTPPTRVGETVTKRMVRKGSTSSHGSGSLQGGGLRRQSSSGSMTERTFRAPSPNRSSPAHQDAPPVPSMPKEISRANGLHRRASSLDPTTRDTSPGPRSGGRGVSLDRGATGTPGRGQRVLSLSQVPEASRDSRQQSINFSRPMSPQQNASPRAPPAGHGQSGWFGGPVINPEVTFRGGAKPQQKPVQGVSTQDLHDVRQTVQNAADRPVKKTQTLHGVEGARLASGSMRAKPSGSDVHPRQSQQPHSVQNDYPQSVDPKSPDAVYDPSTRSFIRKQDAMAKHRAFEEELNEPHEHYLEHHAIPEPGQPRAPQKKSAPVRYQESPVPSREPVPRDESPAQHQRQEQRHGSYVEAATEIDDTQERHLVQPVSQTEAGTVLTRKSSEDFADVDIAAEAVTQADSAPINDTEEDAASPTSPRFPPNQDGPYPRIAATATEAAKSKLLSQNRGSVRAASERNQSLSPPRNAHFAPVAVEFPNGIRHQPPPRSVSPAKSALKVSPSVSRRNSSPIANNGRVVAGGAPSELSDTMSDDGQKKKKKNVRVSFDADSVVVGTSAYAEVGSPASPTGLGASKWSTASDDQDADDFMKPRPVLPSFGSIRDKNRRRSQDDTPEKVTEIVPSSMSTSIGSIGESLEASSDHALGQIVAQDFATKKAAQPAFNEPLPPEVTSVEGSGYVSDSSESTFNEPEFHVIQEKDEQEEKKEVEIVEPARSTPEPEPKTLTTHVENRAPTPASAPPMEVPVISIQMPSPSPNEKPEPKFPIQHVPGGWDEDESEQETQAEKASPMKIITQQPTAAPEKSTPAPEPVLQRLLDNESSDDESDNSSIYSDAYEDLSETEDGGFGSIDAVVESPVVEVSSGLMFSKYADRSQTEQPKSGLQHELHDEDALEGAASSSATKEIPHQHLGDIKKIEETHHEESLATKPTPSVSTTSQKPKAEKKVPVESKAPDKQAPTLASSKQSSQLAQSKAQPRKSALKTATAQPAAPSGPQFRKSMRDTTAVGSAEPQTMRKSMRTPTAPAPTQEPRMRKSMRTTEAVHMSTGPSNLGLAASRHSMPPVESKPPRGALQKRHIPPATTSTQRPKSMQAPVAAKPIVPTYDSDSDASASSFQRSRPRPRQNDRGGRYTMRASMRSGPAPTMRTAPTMRPISPPEPVSPPASSLRKTMRPSSPPEEPIGGLKSSKFSIRSLSPAGRFRSPKINAGEASSPVAAKTSVPKTKPAKIPAFGKQPKQKAAAPETSKPRFKSRFVDSSDEEDDRPRRFQSRFVDSDDDDIPTDLTPVRGIPRRPGEEDGDSTDLDDEASDGEPSPLPAGKDVEKSGSSATNGVTNGQTGFFNKNKAGAELPTMEAGKKAKPKRGFFGLGKKKGTTNETAAPESNSTPTDIPMPPAHRNRELKQQLTPIDEDKGFDIPVSPVPSRSPKLQRRSQPQRDQADPEQWPLQTPPKIGQEQRPQSSDGVPARRTSFRPMLSKRHSSHASQRSNMTAETEPTVDASGREVAFGRSGKKKKFQGLRRVFGLHD